MNAKKIGVILLCLAITVAVCLQMTVFAKTDVTDAAQKAAAYLQQELKVDAESTELDNDLDWAVFALRRSGIDGFAGYDAYIAAAVKANADKLTLNDIARILLAVNAGTPGTKVVGGVDLAAKLKAAVKDEIYTSTLAYALLAAKAAGVADDAFVEQVLTILQTAQRTDSGFNYLLQEAEGNTYSVNGEADVTAVVVTAIAPYAEKSEKDEIKAMWHSSLSFLYEAQLDEGGFGYGAFSTDSTAQAIIALCSATIDFTKGDWAKKTDMLSALLATQKADGGFASSGDKANLMSTYQALNALCAYARSSDNANALFNLGDTWALVVPGESSSSETESESESTQETESNTASTESTDESSSATTQGNTPTSQLPGEISTDETIPKTGDDSVVSPAAWAGLALACIMGLALLLHVQKKELHA